MFVKIALILSRDEKTDDELKAVMATHPWAPAMIHGFHKECAEKWASWKTSFNTDTPDAIWCGNGITEVDRNNKWIVEDFHAPSLLHLRPLYRDSFDEWYRREDELRKQWWRATVELVLHEIPTGYHVHWILYGEIEDEFAAPEAAWRQSLLAFAAE